LLRRFLLSKLSATDAQTRQLDEAKIMALTGRYLTAILLSLALHEVITLLGLMLCLWEQRVEPIFPFAAVSIALNLLVFPRLNKFIDQSAPMKAQF
jgi:hypothetical protein